MDFQPRYIVNTEFQTSSTSIFVNGIIETTYSYQNNLITLSERENQASLSKKNLSENLIIIKNWMQLIKKYIVYSSVSRENFTEEMSKTDTKIMAEFKIDEQAITEAEYDQGTMLFIFSPRDEISLSFSDFLAWNDFLNRFYILGKDF